MSQPGREFDRVPDGVAEVEDHPPPLVRQVASGDLDLDRHRSGDDLFQVGASIMHKPSGLGIYGLYQNEQTSGSSQHYIGQSDGSFITDIDGNITTVFGTAQFFKISNPETDAWYVKPFWRKTWSPVGATTLFVALAVLMYLTRKFDWSMGAMRPKLAAESIGTT